MKFTRTIKSFNQSVLQMRVGLIGITVLQLAAILVVVSGSVTALVATRYQSPPTAPSITNDTTSANTQKPTTKPVAQSTAPTQDTATQPVKPNTTNVAQAPPKADCSAVYYTVTKAYQSGWTYHQQTVKGYTDQINASTTLDQDEKQKQINTWARYFNDRVNELVTVWQKSMNDSGCGSTPMGFSPGYMPVVE